MPGSAVEERIRERSLRDLYYILFRHKGKAILCFLAVVISVTVVTLLSPKIYRSDAKLLVRLGRESVALDPTATTGPIVNVSQSRESEIKSELEILKSQDLAEKVVDTIGPAVLLERADAELSAEDREKAVLGVMQDLEIEVLKESNILSISFEAQSPILAQQVVEKLIEFYLEKHISVYRTLGSYQFFAEQSNELQASLAQFEIDLRDLKNETGISALAEQTQILLKRISDLKREKEQVDAELAASEARVQALRESLAEIPETEVIQETTGFPNFAADGMRERLYELQLMEQDLLSKFAESGRSVQEVRRQIAEAQALLAKEEPVRNQVTQGLSAAHQQVQSALLGELPTLDSLQAKSGILATQLADAQAGLKTLNDGEVAITRLLRESSIHDANYRKYAENLEQARIDHALEIEKISNIGVVQPATYPIKAVRPRKLLNLTLAVLLGIFGALGLAFLSEYLDHSIKTPEDAEERLQLPTLASIQWRGQPKPPNGTASEGSAQRSVSPSVRGHYETIDAFRDRLLLRSNGSAEPFRVFAVTSSHRSEGVSTVAAHLAVSLAWHTDGRVL
ncbi:MAG: GumC family protein, partial [Planctomycetota bacterium]